MNTAKETRKIIESRHKISTDYCISKGWPTDFSELDFDQIMEIRRLDSWKNPLDVDSNQAE